MDSSADDPAAPSGASINFLDLPDCMIEQVLEYLSYDEIAKKRIICRKIDRICQSLLNRGFIKMIRKHNMNLKAIKSQLPRRESERRNHPLSKHSDILTCIETRISMLSMTYSKFIEKELCCFIPGKVIDEVLNILGLIENTSRPLRAHEVLQELRDISSMAIEHFDENIAHRLKKIIGVQHHPKLGSHHNLPFPAAAFIQHEVMLPCDVNGDKFVIPTLTPISPSAQKTHPSATSASSSSPSSSTSSSSSSSTAGGSLGGLYCQSSYNAICENNAAVARINHKTRKMRYDINRIDHTICSFKTEMRNMRLLLSRYGAEMKELRRRLEESETKNLELLANINQLGFGAPSVGEAERTESPSAAVTAATIKQCSIKPRGSANMLKRLYSDTESHSSSSAVVPSSPSSPKEANEGESETQELEESRGTSSAKKMMFVAVLVIAVSMSALCVQAQRMNAFDEIRHCRQYDTYSGYNDRSNFIPTADFVNVVETDSATYYKFAVLGQQDGVVRFAVDPFLFVQGYTEIVLGGWGNMLTTAQHQYRGPSGELWNKKLNEANTPELLSPFHPVMMVLKVSFNGQVDVLLDGQADPILSFVDTRHVNPIRFMAFTKYDKDMIFFYDCPIISPRVLDNEKQLDKSAVQYGNVANYNDPLVYIPTKSLVHVGRTEKSKFFRVAVQGRSDGIIRFGASLYPYDKEVIEIGWSNTKSAGRRQHRAASNRVTNAVLAEIHTPNLLFYDRPTMFLVELFNDGTIQARIDGQDHPFLSFKDGKMIAFHYIAFTKYKSDVVYFYDCPLKDDEKICYENGNISASSTAMRQTTILHLFKLQQRIFYNWDVRKILKIRDCQQHINLVDYNGPLRYLSTANLRHVRQTSNSKIFKIGVLAPNDGIIRFGKSQFPYDTDVIEIVLGGWSNSRSAGRRQRRTASNRNSNVVLTEIQTPNLLSPFYPTMFLLEVFNEGRVEVRLEGHPQPFLSFHDNNRIPANYMAFTKWDKDLIFFYDLAVHQNSFDAIRGCKQYDSSGGYDQPVPYFPVANMLHVGHTASSQFFRVGILGPQDAHVRYGRTLFPYDQDVIEIAVKGCIQYDDVPGYNDTPLYLATNTFRNVGRTSNSRIFRIGIVGANDGHIRFGRSPYPFDETVVELVISGWSNTQSVARRQTRRRDQSFDNVLLKEASTPRLLHKARPLVFRMEVFDNGHVKLTKDGELRPFFEYSDSQNVIPPEYMAFVKWDVDLIYFYDCPLIEEASLGGADSVLLRCSLA
uniref:F-box domain-containing protein n=1 Tax=Anopheles epiroticus TaxID=199890 RepID=A0A182PAZ9_9DIPT